MDSFMGFRSLIITLCARKSRWRGCEFPRHPRLLLLEMAYAYLQRLDGGNPRQLTFDRAQINALTWTAEGRSIVYGANREGAARLWKVPAKGGTPEPIYAAGQNVGQPSISRSGNRLVFREY